MARTLRNVSILPFLVVNARRVHTRNGAVQESRAVDELREHGFHPRPRSTRRSRPEVTSYSDRPNAGYLETRRRRDDA